MVTHSSILAWRTPQRSLEGYRTWSRKDSDTTEWRSTHRHTHTQTHTVCLKEESWSRWAFQLTVIEELAADIWGGGGEQWGRGQEEVGMGLGSAKDPLPTHWGQGRWGGEWSYSLATRNIKLLGTNLTRNVHNSHKKSYETLVSAIKKEWQEDINQYGTDYISREENSLSLLFYKFNIILN